MKTTKELSTLWMQIMVDWTQTLVTIPKLAIQNAELRTLSSLCGRSATKKLVASYMQMVQFLVMIHALAHLNTWKSNTSV